MQTKLSWWNYRTQEYELRDAGVPLTDEDAERYLQPGPMFGIYQCRRALGDSIPDAMEKALLAGLPEEFRFPLEAHDQLNTDESPGG
jgi:hypothetical protein